MRSIGNNRILPSSVSAATCLLLIAAGKPWAGPGGVKPSADPALPRSFGFQDYRFPEPADDAPCGSAANATAKIQHVYFDQTHALEPGWPFFLLTAGRPALLEAVVTGSGASPQVRVQAFVKGAPIGSLCLKGPATLPAGVAENQHGFADRFTATLPAAWVQPGLSVEIQAGDDTRKYGETDLKVGAAPELNLIMLPMDILDYNKGKADIPVPATFLENFASAIPASVTRFGYVPARMALPKMVVSPDSGQPVVIETKADKKGIPDGNINGAALRFIDAFKEATGGTAWAYYYGNTENFFPGGWGGGKAFVGADYTDVFIHEMGHALSLPHWGEGAYQNTNPASNDYRYPYGGSTNDGGGRGEMWNYYQNLHEFISPICAVPGNKESGKERSDAMQRTHHCNEMRSTGPFDWDGFGDFSAYAISRYMVGAATPLKSTVPYKASQAPFILPAFQGYPTLKLGADGKRSFVRNFQPAETQSWETLDFLVPQQWDTPVYTVYGTYHPQYAQADILYDPMAYVGNLPRVLDPTDSLTFKDLAAGTKGSYRDYFWGGKDLTFKFTFADGTVRYALYPYGSVDRNWKPGSGIWRFDLLYFAITIPADKKLARIELYLRPFTVEQANSTAAGNVANPALGITARNFMQGATLVMARDVNVDPPKPLALAAARTAARPAAWRLAPEGVVFDGLADGAIVTLYDIRGHVTRTLQARGGRAVWAREPSHPGAGGGVYPFTIRTGGEGAAESRGVMVLGER